MAIDVKWFTSEMRGAPVINGNTPGCYINLLDTLLLPTGGFGLSTALSVTVADGIATATLNAGQTFLPHAVVAVSGATPAALNGEARVLTSSSTSITFATSAPDGAATGTIVIKYAPVGHWEKAYSKTNVAVYRSAHPLSKGHCLRVDDTGNLHARVVAYESMTDVDTGTGPFATNAQMTGGGYWHKRGAANAAAAKWKLAGDGLIFFPAVAPYSDVATSLCAPLRGFGYPIPLRPAGDDFLCILSAAGNSSTVAGALDGASGSSVNGGSTAAHRSYTGLGGSVLLDSKPYTGVAGNVSGTDNTLGAFPSEIDGRLKLSQRFLSEQGTGKPDRGVVPGVYYAPQSGVYGAIADGATEEGSGDLAGRRVLGIGGGSNLNTAPNGIYFVDIFGPWR